MGSGNLMERDITGGGLEKSQRRTAGGENVIG